MKYGVEISKYNTITGVAEPLQYDVFESSVQKVAYQRRTLESVIKEELRPLFVHPSWVNDVLNEDGTLNPDGKIDPNDQSNLRCNKIAFGDNGDRYHLVVQAAADDAEVTVKTRGTSNAEQKQFYVIVEELDGDEVKVTENRKVTYASEGGVKHALKESGNYTEFDGSKWSKHPNGGIFRDNADGTKALIIREVNGEDA